MRVFTPVEVTQHVANKYLSVLVADLGLGRRALAGGAQHDGRHPAQ